MIRTCEAPAMLLTANGVQIYTCMPSPVQPDAYAWHSTAPDATLYDGTRGVARLATADHWESLDDRSSVSGIPVRMQAGGDETHVGTEARVDFSADYYFYKRAVTG